MFIHRNSGRRPAAVSLGILTAAAIAQLAPAETPEPLVLVAYGDRAGGEPLTSGNYGSAAQALQSAGNGALADPQALNTNRCVAYAMTRQLAPARAACDAAVRAPQGSASPIWSPQARRQAALCAAVAYSNRAVPEWLDAQPAAARRDLGRAQALAPEAAFVARNMIAMRARQNVSSPATATTTLAAAHE
jgi:hypothetical protein